METMGKLGVAGLETRGETAIFDLQIIYTISKKDVKKYLREIKTINASVLLKQFNKLKLPIIKKILIFIPSILSVFLANVKTQLKLIVTADTNVSSPVRTSGV